jgi:hypothetical protein
MLLRTAKSCGPDAPTLASSSRMLCRPYRARTQRWFADDGGKKARSPGSAKETVKTIACGNAGRFRCTRCYSCAFYYHNCTRGRGCNGHPAFPTPSLGRKINANLGRIAPRDREAAFDEYECAATFVERSDNSLQAPSFRDGPKDQASDAQLRIGESRDSGFDASHRPGMTALGLSAEPVIGPRFARTRWRFRPAMTIPDWYAA